MKKMLLVLVFLLQVSAYAQNLRWVADGNSFLRVESGEINRYILPANTKTTFVCKTDLTPVGQSKSLTIRNYSVSEDQTKLLNMQKI